MCVCVCVCVCVCGGGGGVQQQAGNDGGFLAARGLYRLNDVQGRGLGAGRGEVRGGLMGGGGGGCVLLGQPLRTALIPEV